MALGLAGRVIVPSLRIVRSPGYVSRAPAQPGYSIGIEAGGRGENPMIVHVQAKLGRNPFYLTRNEREPIKAAIAKVFAAQVMASLRAQLGRPPRPDNSADTVAAHLLRIGERMLKVMLGHVKAQTSKGGVPFRALTDSYAAYKRRKYGFTVPILKATGDLLGGLRVRVDRL